MQATKRAKRHALFLGLALTVVIAAQAATEQEVGDPDSFRRSVTYLGFVHTPRIVLHPTCIPSPPSFTLKPTDRCIILNPQPARTTFDEGNLGAIVLPANASKSLLCYTLSPLVTVDYFNTTTNAVTAEVSFNARVTIRNDLLNDPSLINPLTGQPFAGSLTAGLGGIFDKQGLLGGEGTLKSLATPHECDLGLISKRLLVNSYGLSEAQATAFFGRPMTLTFAASGSASAVQILQARYIMRLFGDQ